MKRFTILLLIISAIPIIAFSQEKSKFGISFSGFVKSDIYWDSRQTVAIRDGQFMLYPMNENLDPDGNDINARSTFNMISIQTRVSGIITGPDAFGAKTSGMIEGAFFGQSGGDINGFRLRHAFVKLNWTKTELLVGQYWHAMFITKSFPGTVSFNTGVPFQPFSRNPQIRLTQKLGKFSVIATAMTEVDFMDNGPVGPNTRYIRNAGLPEFNLRFEFFNKKTDKDCEFFAGIGGNFKMLRPQIASDSGYQTKQTVEGYAGQFYAKWKNPKLTVKVQAVYGQMFYSMTMLGGYAVEKVIDPVKGYVQYIPTNTMSFWGDIHTNGKKWQVGVFGGYTKNMGADKNFIAPNYSRGGNIAYVYRIAPRFIYNAGKFRIAPELDYTVAAYGTPDIADKGIVKNTKEIGNFRVLLGVFYFF
ncbi:hypothetical protein ACFLRY_04535 [Bacteroidota bacterium]